MFILVVMKDDSEEIAGLGLYKTERDLVRDLKLVVGEGGDYSEEEIEEARSFLSLDILTDGFHWGENDTRTVHMYEISGIDLDHNIGLEWGS